MDSKTYGDVTYECRAADDERWRADFVPGQRTVFWFPAWETGLGFSKAKAIFTAGATEYLPNEPISDYTTRTIYCIARYAAVAPEVTRN